MDSDSPKAYIAQLTQTLTAVDWRKLDELTHLIQEAWRNRRRVYMCGNGGSAATANHLVNDFACGVGLNHQHGVRVESLCANSSVITCLANDAGYDHIFAHQLRTLAEPNDVLIVFSGSGNSPNILEVLKAARQLGVKSAALLGFAGGKAKDLADIVLHFPVDDMQIAEDAHMVAGHMLLKALKRAEEASIPAERSSSPLK